jgi:fatty acid desaturase
MPRWRRVLTALTLATPLKFFASVGRFLRCAEGFDLRLHPKATRPWVWASWALPIVFAALTAPALIAASGGLGGLLTYWAGPWLAFHAWLSVLSLVQHTGPHITWAEEVRAEWGQGGQGGTH